MQVLDLHERTVKRLEDGAVLGLETLGEARHVVYLATPLPGQRKGPASDASTAGAHGHIACVPCAETGLCVIFLLGQETTQKVSSLGAFP